MNKIYRLIWNTCTRSWIAVAETAAGRGKSAPGRVDGRRRGAAGRLRWAPALLVLQGIGAVHAAPPPPPLPAPTQLPTGGHVVAGQATIGQGGASMTVDQTTQRAVIDWNTFNLGSQAQVRFVQPTSASVMLNRVLDANPSAIFGSISANGQVFLTNPNGVYFAPGASVDVGGLAVSTASLSTGDFMAGNAHFTASGAAGSIVNDGKLSAGIGGYVALLAPEVRNQGVIVATLGTVALAAGDAYQLQFNGNRSLANILVTPATVHALVDNGQAIEAPGGQIILSAQAASSLIGSVVHNSGTLEARGLSQRGGVIRLDAGPGQVDVSGTLDASAPAGKGGRIVVTGRAVGIDDGATLNASGATGGGLIEVGGSRQDSDPTVAQAVQTRIASTAVLDASATVRGDGGTVVAWSNVASPDSTTAVHGTLEANGGALGGNGGSIETSGHRLDVAGIQVGTRSQGGAIGQWLLDPYDITVAASGGTITGAALAAALNTTNVTLDTTGTTGSGATYGSPPPSGAGDITINDAIGKTGTAATTLTLKAHNDIVINRAIGSSAGRLNVVLTADQDNSGAGDVIFGAAGSVTTAGGNFYAGAVSGSTDVLTAMGHNVTMASGSFVNAGTGNLGISVKGNIQLPDNSAQATTYALTALLNTASYRYYDNGNAIYTSNSPYQFLSVATTLGSITTAGSNAAVADIVSSVPTTLSAPSIGSAGAPIKLSGPADPYGLLADPIYSTQTFVNTAQTLSIYNSLGSSYVSEVGVQIFKTIGVHIGSQANQTQSVSIMGDQGGNGHITLNTDGSGVLALATGDIITEGVAGVGGSYPTATNPSLYPTSVSLSASNITFADHSVNTGASLSYYNYGSGSYYEQTYGRSGYGATFSAQAGTLTSAQVDGVADISAVTTQLTATTLGTSASPIEVGAVSTLSLDNTGGSTFVKVVDNSVGNVSLETTNTIGEHHVLWSGGDHLDVTTDATGMHIPTIGGGRSNGTDFTATHGIDLSGGNDASNGRSVTVESAQGAIELGTDAIDAAGGSVTVMIASGNTLRTGLGQAIYATNPKDGNAEITGGSATFDIYSSTLGTITDVEIAKGGTGTNNTLTVYTNQGNVDLVDLAANQFKTVSVTLTGASTAQNVSIAMVGPDDVNFSDSGSQVTIDATKVNLSSSNANWYLSLPSRLLEVDGTALGTGYYTLSAGSGIKLDANVLTNGGAISLTGGGAGIMLMTPVLVDSNADTVAATADTGAAGSITLTGTISSYAPAYALLVSSASSTTSGGTITVNSSASNGAGAYLTGLALTSKGSTNTNDGTIYLYGNYALDGTFSSIGNSTLESSAMTIRTDASNVGNAGNILFGGYALTNAYSGAQQTFNASTTATGMNGGNVDLYDTYGHGALSNASWTISATGGSGGTSGLVDLPAINATISGATNTQAISGGQIVLHGNIATEQGNVSLTGDVQLATNLTISTWQTATAGTTPQSGTAGSVTIGGIGVSAQQANTALTIDANANTGSGWFDAPTNSSAWAQNGGAVSVIAGSSGGQRLASLTIDTTATGSHNTGSAGSIALDGVATSGNQSFAAGSVTIGGALSGATIALDTSSGSSGATIASSDGITAGQLLLKGNGTNYNFSGGSGNAVAALAATGAAAIAVTNDTVDLNVANFGGVNGISATGSIQLVDHSGNIVLAGNLASTSTASNAIVVDAGSNTAAANPSGGNVSFSGTPTVTTGAGGRATFYTGSVAGSTGVVAAVGSGSGHFRYDSTAASSGFDTGAAPLGTGIYAVYREQPTLTVTASSATKTYDGLAYAGGNGFVAAGLINGDSAASMAGSPVYSGTSQSAVDAGTYGIGVGGVTNSLGYAVVTVAGALTVDKAPLTVTANDVGRSSGGQAFSGGGGVTYAGLVNGQTGDVLHGSLAYGGNSQGAVAPGHYEIAPQGLTSSNYAIGYVDGTLTLAPAAVPVSPPSPVAPVVPVVPVPPLPHTAPVVLPPVAASGAGVGPAPLTVTSPTLPAVLTVTQVQAPSAQQPGLVDVDVPKSLIAAGGGFSFPLPTAAPGSASGSGSGGGNGSAGEEAMPAQLSTATGEALPTWVQFDAATRVISAASVPSGGLPLRLVVTVGGVSTTVVISEETNR